ncbi:hypothetical protein [Primorskyibacter sp. S87]|uniref:hypothetical protein n=1 Tax=Primorskyibacter sp. S87 TaxID=3415126 RepID=UPI003C7DF106
MTTTKTAFQTTRALIKGLGYFRSQITDASRAEERREKGASAKRRRLTARFAQQCADAEQAVTDTLALADKFDAASMALKTGASDDDPLATLCAMAARFGADVDPLVAATDLVATRARSGAERAAERLDQHDAAIRSLALHCQWCAGLAEKGFDRSDPALRSIRSEAARLSSYSNRGTNT